MGCELDSIDFFILMVLLFEFNDMWDIVCFCSCLLIFLLKLINFEFVLCSISDEDSVLVNDFFVCFVSRIFGKFLVNLLLFWSKVDCRWFLMGFVFFIWLLLFKLLLLMLFEMVFVIIIFVFIYCLELKKEYSYIINVDFYK